MRIVDLGTFLFPVRLSLGDLLTVNQPRVVDALAREFAEFDLRPQMDSDVLLDYHRSIGARQMQTLVFQGSTTIEGVGRVQLSMSSLSVGFVVAELELPDDIVVDLETTGSRTSFKAHETPLTNALAPRIAEWSQRFVRALDPAWTEARPAAAMPAGRLLWWHRIGVNPPEGHEFPAARFYGVTAALAEETTCIVGNGFTNLSGPRLAVIPDVIEGLMVATQEWLIVDEAKRVLAEHLIRLARSRHDDLIDVDTQYLEVLRLTEEVTVRNLVIAEEVRYLANARSRVKDAAATAWKMSAEAAELEQRASALSDLFALHRERITNDRDDRRNRYIFVFTALTLIQSLMIGYDFLTENDTTVAGAPRPPIAIAVLLLTLIVLLGAVGFRQLGGVRRRLRRASRPHPATPRQAAPRQAAPGQATPREGAPREAAPR